MIYKSVFITKEMKNLPISYTQQFILKLNLLMYCMVINKMSFKIIFIYDWRMIVNYNNPKTSIHLINITYYYGLYLKYERELLHKKFLVFYLI